VPERLAYDEAMQLSQVRLRIQDSDLIQGSVERIQIQTAVGSIERPWGIAGGFAIVYKFRTKGGKLRALRCFSTRITPDIQFRYERIGVYFANHVPHITIGFKYHEQGILVKEAVSGLLQKVIYPIIEMDWVEGETLLGTVNKLCTERKREDLLKIANQWLTLFITLKQNHIAHGDLSSVDVIVRSDGQLILIDYDGVYIPDFSGLSPLLLGKADYQHPQMAQRKFNEHMDDFSALVIYTALQALAIQPELWDKYACKTPQGKLLDTNFLFSHKDFQDPNQSALIYELQYISDTRLQLAVKELKKACQQPIDQVGFPFHIIRELQ
jgi:hypothetical protein